MHRFLFLAFAILLFGLGGSRAEAQATDAASFTIEVSPRYPKPYETVSVTPASSLLDLTASTVSISANGEVVQKGSGTQAAGITVGGPGEKTTISVSINAPDGRTYTDQVVVRPADVALIVEPTSTAPPFYPGAHLVASEGRVRIVAVPDLRTDPKTRLSAQNLVYTWKLGDQILQSSSGIGKSVLTATAPVRYRDSTITLTVTTPDNSVVAQQQATIAAAEPFVRIYRNDPLLGPDFAIALSGQFSMADEEATFRAAPYFFAAPPALAWTIGGSIGGEDKDLTVRATGDGGGTASLSLSAKHPDFHQSAQAALSVKFGTAKGFGLFGL